MPDIDTPLLEVPLDMTWLHTRFFGLACAVLVSAVFLIGCSSKEDPSEVLPMCGNHSCGDLAMITADTSSDGFHYLNPSMSPDGQRILFTADWKALPSIDHYNEDDFYTTYRQMAVIPVQRRVEPENNLADQGAELIRLEDMTVPDIGQQGEYLGSVVDYRKGGPIWEDDNHIIFWLKISRGNRLFRADITDLNRVPIRPLLLEETDRQTTGFFWQHMEPTLSPDKQWLAFTRSGCFIPDSLETCTQLSLMVLDMATAGDNNGYDAVVFTVVSDTMPNEVGVVNPGVSYLGKPSWSPDGDKIVFSAGLDLDGGNGLGTELYTVDFDAELAAAGEVPLNNNVKRLTYTEYSEGDPILGVYNTSPFYSNDGSDIYFVSTRRAPSTTHHDRSIWRIPADGSFDPEIFFFTRSDDVDCSMTEDGGFLMSSLLGFPTYLLDAMEEESYQRLRQNQPDRTELEMRQLAADDRKVLELFEGVMSHLYMYRP